MIYISTLHKKTASSMNPLSQKGSDLLRKAREGIKATLTKAFMERVNQSPLKGAEVASRLNLKENYIQFNLNWKKLRISKNKVLSFLNRESADGEGFMLNRKESKNGILSMKYTLSA